MSKIKIVLLALVLIAAGVAAWVFIPTHTSLGPQVSSTPIGEEFSLVGYKIVSTDRKLNKMNQYFLIANGSELGDNEPVLTTSDQFLRVVAVKDNTFKLSVKDVLSNIAMISGWKKATARHTIGWPACNQTT